MGVIESALDTLPSDHQELWVAAKRTLRVLVGRKISAGAEANSLLVVLASPMSDVGDAILEHAALCDDGTALVAVLDGALRTALLKLFGVYRVEDVPPGHVLVLTDPGEHPGLSVAKVIDVGALS